MFRLLKAVIRTDVVVGPSVPSKLSQDIGPRSEVRLARSPLA